MTARDTADPGAVFLLALFGLGRDAEATQPQAGVGTLTFPWPSAEVLERAARAFLELDEDGRDRWRALWAARASYERTAKDVIRGVLTTKAKPTQGAA